MNDFGLGRPERPHLGGDFLSWTLIRPGLVKGRRAGRHLELV